MPDTSIVTIIGSLTSSKYVALRVAVEYILLMWTYNCLVEHQSIEQLKKEKVSIFPMMHKNDWQYLNSLMIYCSILHPGVPWALEFVSTIGAYLRQW